MKTTAALRKAEDKLRRLNDLAGYQEVLVPDFAKAEIYREGISDEKMVVFLLGSDLYALRPDFSTAIIHELVKKQQSAEKLLVAYFGKVFRKDEGLHELYQAGVECFFDNSTDTDSDVINHAGKYLSALGFNDNIICIGLVQFVQGLVKKMQLSEDKITALIRAMQQHNHVTLKLFLQQNLSEQNYQEIWRMLTSRDNMLTLPLLAKHFPEVYYTSGIEALVKNLETNYVLDLSLVKSLDYYTGIVFDAYVPQYPYSILSGGRYDKLAAKYGRDFAAVGFAMNLNFIWENSNDQLN